MFKKIVYILIGMIITVTPTVYGQSYSGGDIGMLQQFTSTTTPISAITQRIYGKSIKLTGLTAGSNLCLDSNNLITTSGCASGGGGGSSSLYASSTNPLMATYFVATSTNTASRINSYLKIGDVIPLQLSGLGSDYSDFQIDKDRDDTVVMNLFNRSAGPSATTALFLNNNNTTLGGAGLSAKYYAGFVLAGGNWDGTPYGLGALPKNGAVLYNTDAPIIIASPTSTGAIYMYTGAGSYAGGTPDMLLDSSGRLGIGSTPAVNLDVKKSGTGEVARFTITDGATVNGLRVSVDTATANHITTLSSTGSFTGGFAFKTGATEVLRIATSGNVGIGSTSPSARLTIKGLGATTGKLLQTTDSSDNVKLTILDNGDVGIGTTSPLADLHVVGDTNFVYGQELTYPLWVSSPSNSQKALIMGYNQDKDVGEIAAVERGVAFKNLVLQSTGKLLGVGTTTPWATLSVAGTNGQTNANPVFAVSTSTATFATTTALMVDGSGRVGIATKSPSTALTVGDGSLLQIPNGVGTSITPDILVSNSNATSGTASIALGVSDGTRNRRVGLFLDDKNSIAGISSTYGGTSFPFIMRDAGGERMRIGTTGNVNVGTSTTAGQSAQFSIRNTSGLTNAIQLFSGTSNTTLFSVNGTNGNVTMNGNLSATGGSVTTVNGVFNSTAAVVPVLANGSASQTANLFEASKALVKYTVIDSGGDVGAGTSTPMAKLSATAKTINETTFALQGLTGQTGNLMSIYPSNSSTTVFSMNPTGGIFANSASTTLYFAGLLSSGTGNALCITTNNQVTNAGGGTCTPSSEKYKNSIKDFNGNALDELNKLKIVTFNYNDGVMTTNKGDTKQRIGMIAEQVEKIDPRLVIHKDGSPDSLNDRDLLSLTIKAVQEQQKEIDSLKAEINRLKK